MTFDDLSKQYDGIIPQEEKSIFLLGSRQAYYAYFLDKAEKEFSKRCLQIVQSVAAWRRVDRYTADVKEMMLARLQKILRQSRASALKAVDLSNVAVTAAPIRIA